MSYHFGFHLMVLRKLWFLYCPVKSGLSVTQCWSWLNMRLNLNPRPQHSENCQNANSGDVVSLNCNMLVVCMVVAVGTSESFSFCQKSYFQQLSPVAKGINIPAYAHMCINLSVMLAKQLMNQQTFSFMKLMNTGSCTTDSRRLPQSPDLRKHKHICHSPNVTDINQIFCRASAEGGRQHILQEINNVWSVKLWQIHNSPQYHIR